MTQIDFYALKPGSRSNQLHLTCRLVARIYRESLRVLIHCPDRARAQALDELLWRFREDSFIPHGLYDAVDPELTPILISSDGQSHNESKVLINLDTAVPEFFNHFERLCEPVDQDPAILAAARQRWQHYRAAGYSPNHHPLDG